MNTTPAPVPILHTITSNGNMAQEYAFHPAADVFPLLQGEDFDSLVTNIRSYGFDPAHPILLLDGMILDGRNRYRAAKAANVEPIFAQWQGEANPFKFAWQENAVRRHLDPGIKAACYVVMLRGSAGWERERLERQLAANEARSTAAKEQHEVSRPWAGETMDGRVSIDTTPFPEKRLMSHEEYMQQMRQSADWARQKAAREAGVSEATMGRAMALEQKTPELISRAAAGEMTLNEACRQQRKADVQAKLQAFPSDKFRVIYADPPWSYGDKREEIGKWKGRELDYGPVEGHYPAMSLEDICALDVESLADDSAVLFLWVTAPLLPQAFQVISRWGFEYKAQFVWDKVAHNMGHYNSVRHELLLIATHGTCLPDNNKLLDSVQSIEKTKEHSQKPEQFRVIIDTLYPHGKRIELFVRGELPSPWHRWGAEVTK